MDDGEEGICNKINKEDLNECKQFVTLIHEKMGHICINILITTIINYFRIVNLKAIVTEVVKECLSCQRNKQFVNNDLRVHGYLKANH